jgi:hypothetical protein
MPNLLEGNATSGLPGTLFQCNRYPLKWVAQSERLRISSGNESLALLALIIFDVSVLTGIGDLPSLMKFSLVGMLGLMDDLITALIIT